MGSPVCNLTQENIRRISLKGFGGQRLPGRNKPKEKCYHEYVMYILWHRQNNVHIDVIYTKNNFLEIHWNPSIV